MEEYESIENIDDIQTVLNVFGGFHDCLLKEVHMINRAFTDNKKQMHMNFKIDAEVYFQSQYQSKGLFLLLEDVICYSMKEQSEVYEGEGLYINNYKEKDEEKQKEVIISLDTDMFIIKARKAAYKFEDNSFGSKSRLKNEIPNINMVSAEKMGSNIRLCSCCASPIEIDDNEAYAFCETCYNVTESKGRKLNSSVNCNND